MWVRVDTFVVLQGSQVAPETLCCSRLQCVAVCYSGLQRVVAGCTAATLTHFTDEKYNECAKRDTYIVKRGLCESKETYVCVSQKKSTKKIYQ